MILASGSPQRRAILEQLGLKFQVVVSDAEELVSGPPAEVAAENAYRKAADVVARFEQRNDGGAVLGVDTVVALGPEVYGKPPDRDAARATLERLSGREHRVLSGVCVIDERVRSAVAVTTVRMRNLDQQTLNWYLDSDEWKGRAGGYAIQARGAALVKEIEGEYLNVVGLPVQTLLDLLPDLLRGSA